MAVDWQPTDHFSSITVNGRGRGEIGGIKGNTEIISMPDFTRL